MDLNFLNFTQAESNSQQQQSQDSSASKEDQILRECEVYCHKNQVKELLKDCIVQLCLRKPDNPISFLKQHFEKLEKVIIFSPPLFFCLDYLNSLPLSTFTLSFDQTFI
jgi:hypothetical protein